MGIFESILIAASLCADCFAVSLCSGVSLRRIEWRSVLGVALAFAFIQTGLLFAGWALGNLVVSLVFKISHVIGFLLLLYVGAEMLLGGIRSIRTGCTEARDLNGIRNVIIGGIATSIDALAVGVSQSMAGVDFGGVLPLLVSVFVITAASVVAGIFGGSKVGARLGHWAEVAGGIVLIGIGIGVLLG